MSAKKGTLVVYLKKARLERVRPQGVSDDVFNPKPVSQ
jgi:hypothetical protein